MQKDYEIQHPSEKIKGLSYIKEFITKEEQLQLIKKINQQEWNTSLKRRTQHYGYEYRYDRKNQVVKAGEIPEWAVRVKRRVEEFVNKQINLRVEEDKSQPIEFNQLIINEYLPGQGINPHVDNPTLFSSPIVSVSLGSECVMEFDNEKVLPQESVQVWLKRRSIIVLDSEARYQWKHSIPGRKKDHGRMRAVRVSLTWRVMREHKQLDNLQKKTKLSQ